MFDLSRRHYRALLFLLGTYLAAQVMQQWVLRIGPMTGALDVQSRLLAGLHPANIARLSAVLLSMFLMLPGYLLLTIAFLRAAPVLSVLSFVFFATFCLFEIAYRSLELFVVVIGWGKAFGIATAAERISIMERYADFYQIVDATYFPLLVAHLFASLLLLAAAKASEHGRLVVIAMGINALRIASRLSAFTSLSVFNIFSGRFYFIPVALTFGLLITWAYRRSRAGPDVVGGLAEVSNAF